MKWSKRRKTVMVIAVSVLALAVLVYFIAVPGREKVETALVSTGTFQETIRSDGMLRSKERYTVTAFADGDIKRVSIKPGDPVRKREVITELFWDSKYVPVRAPIGGVVSKVYRESAGPIRRGDPIVEIVDPARLEVMAELLTTDAVRLKAGTEAWIENWAGGDPIKAKVIRISKAGFVKQSALGVEEERTEVTAELLNPPASSIESVGNAFHVDVTFKVSEIKNALKVPVGSLFRDGADWAVYRAVDRRARKTKVEIGAIGSQEALIKSGLQEGQEVLVYPGDLVNEGTRIQPDNVPSRSRTILE